jgi:ankyrin repeat protein
MRSIAAALFLPPLMLQVIASAQSRGQELARAVEAGEQASVAQWLSKGADANGFDRAGKPLLLRAIVDARFGVAKQLVRAGADPLIRDARGNTLLRLALQAGEFKLAEALAEST